jgi:NitT/TauT family transport system ATP-binding protein
VGNIVSDSGNKSVGIAIDSVTHRFGPGQLTLDNVSLNVEPGEFVAIVGPSGCGKTTLLNLVAGLLPTQEGTITLANEQPRPGHPLVGYMLARDALFGWRTVRRNVELGAEIRGQDEALREIRAVELIRQVGLAGYEDAYPKALSHGMRQRAALARTFCLDVAVLLMDEPFGALDAQTKLQLEDLLLDLWTRERRTVLFVTHDLNEALVLADRVVVMGRNPGTIRLVVQVTLPRPREARMLQSDPHFHDLSATIWRELEGGMGPWLDR